jgi:GT2 family glycosyltransferase
MLTSACALKIPAGLEWELIVVDNGGDDETRQILGRFAGRLPIRSAFEPVPGLARARNRGVAEARGRYICWTDDDVELDPDWLSAYRRAFARHPEAALFGGRIVPQLQSPPRAWFARCLSDWPLSAVTACREPAEVAPIVPAELPWGANFAVRTAEQRRLAYDPNLGHSDERPRLADETDLLFRLLEQGAQGWWVPDSLVWHRIAAERQTRSHVLRYFRVAGATANDLHRRRKGNNANEIDGRRPWAAMAWPVLLLLWGGASILSALAWALGHERLSLRMLARRGLATGILSSRRRSGRRSATGFEGVEATG